jgi:hypothetical protein
MVSPEAMDDDYNNVHYFILDRNTTNLLQQQQTFPTQEQFYPHGQFSTFLWLTMYTFHIT